MSGIHLTGAKTPEGMRLFAVGDVHGRLDLLEAMLARIEANLSARPPADWRIVLLGDYIDRGPDSSGVLELLRRRRAADPRLVLLCGNHDAGLLSFLARPATHTLFAGHGGRDTALSYGVEADFGSEPLAQAARDALLAAIPREHLDLLRSLALSASFGDFFFCHAGIRPGVPLEAQEADDLLWIRGAFLGHDGLHPKLVVHGHTPNPEAELLPNRVNLDTGAFATGRLTALVMDGAAKELMTVEGRPIAWR